VPIATKGDNITIHFYNLDTIDKHTFTIGAPYNVSEYIVPHHNETLTFNTNQEGIFRFYLLTIN
jgi:hypothetical protein